MTSKRELEKRVDDLDDDPATLEMDAIWEWTSELSERGTDTPRPPEYFPEDADWSADVREMHETMAARAPELKARLRKVIARLEELGFEPDKNTMYRVVERLKCEEQIGGSDTEILRRATEHGLNNSES